MVERGAFRCKERSEPRNGMGVLLAEGMGINFLTVASHTAIGV